MSLESSNLSVPAVIEVGGVEGARVTREFLESLGKAARQADGE
jgi:hypothetical protein